MAYMPYNISEPVRKTVNKFTIEFYERENGDIPVEEFLISLDDGIFEIRGKVGTDISRVLYFFYYEGKIIFTNGFIKKTQKTSKLEIEKAKMYRNNYLERRCENNEKI